MSYLCLLSRCIAQSAPGCGSAGAAGAAGAARTLLLRSARSGGRSSLGSWRHPADDEAMAGKGSAGGGFGELPLAAFLTEVGMRIEPAWASAATVANVAGKLRLCGIESTAALTAALLATDRGASINQRLKKSGKPAFRPASLSVMRDLVLNKV